ncbi:MAG: NADH-quinone oxidoreductase subunit L [Chloroflexi bacterium]|nr:NADH-quinone oxidoreductase subunit L [Chloroflexota bacterium]
MSDLLLWAFLFTLPGLLMTAVGVGRRPGAASQGGPAAIMVVALAALATGGHAELDLPGWLPFLPDGAFHLRVDALSAVMLAVVGAVSTCVYVFSLGYMEPEVEGDGNVRRFFCLLDFFVASMSILVLAGNIAVLLVGWTCVGISSFLLISFWNQKEGTLSAGLQALAANAVGDAALLVALVLVPAGCGDLTTLGTTACMAGPGGATLLALLILIAASAKSAQGPLYFWLPSAMAGPTPVSALIHAATMVAAGVYLLARTHSLMEAAPSIALATAVIGVLTAVIGGGLSLIQGNFKRGLAYSTVSQLGYMFAAVGFGVPFAAMFHLVTHASFKALLFLTAGVVIHALHGREKLADMGGLRKDLPGAYAAFLVGSLALIGLPFFSGGFSKDLIIDVAQSHDRLYPLLWGGLLAGAFLTGMYTGRLFFGVFHGPKRYHGTIHTPAGTMLWSLVPLAIGAVVLGYLEWPAPLLSNLLRGTAGEAEAIHFPTLIGLIPGVLGLAGFFIAGWRPSAQPVAATASAHAGEHYVEPLEPGVGWADWAADGSYAVAGAVARFQSGHLGRYILISVLGVAVILLVTLAGVSQMPGGVR